MTGYRRNSVVIDFNVMPVRPDINSVTKFIAQVLKVDLKRIKNLQLNNSRNHVIIELETPEEAVNLADRHNLKHKVGYRGHGYAIPIFLEDNAVEIRVHDLPPYMPAEIIVARLEAYGEVKSIRDEVWREHFPGIPNGVRAVRMVINKPIPSYITVDTESAYIVYKGQKATCRHCAKPTHHGKKCVDAKTPTVIPKTSPTPINQTNQQQTQLSQAAPEIENEPQDISSDDDEQNKASPETAATAWTITTIASNTVTEQRTDGVEKRITGNNKRSGSPTLEEVDTTKLKQQNTKPPKSFFRRIDRSND